MSSNHDSEPSAVPPPLPDAPTSTVEPTGSEPSADAMREESPERAAEFGLEDEARPRALESEKHRERKTTRLAPSLVVLFGAIPFTTLVASIALAIVYLAQGEPSSSSESGMVQFVRDLAASPNALWYLVLPGQLAFLVAGVVPALLSSTPFRLRLGLVRPRLAWSTWLLVLAGQLGILLTLTGLFSRIYPEPSGALQDLANMIATASGPRVWIAYLLVAILPGVSEELVFRGYAQSRLERVWPAWRAIGLTALIFTLAHWDPQHMSGVLPIALYLGFVRWATGSTWVTIACHVLNNAVGIALGDSLTDEASTLANAAYIVAAALFALCTVLAIRELLRGRRVRATPVAG